MLTEIERAEIVERMNDFGEMVLKEFDDLRAKLAAAEAERDALRVELDAVMHSIDKWLPEGEKDGDPATRASDAREIALKEIDRLTKENDDLEEELRKGNFHLQDVVNGHRIQIVDLDGKLQSSIRANAELSKDRDRLAARVKQLEEAVRVIIDMTLRHKGPLIMFAAEIHTAKKLLEGGNE